MQVQRAWPPASTGTIPLLVMLLAALLGACSSKPKVKPIVCDQGSICQDSDCDTICDFDEGDDRVDTDRDGKPNYRDTDSDNDGIPDQEEAGDDDPKTAPLDRNHDGIADYLQKDYPLHVGSLPRVDAGQSDGGVRTKPTDAGARDAASVYVPDSGPIQADLCPASSIVPSGCIAGEYGQLACDGLDNDCDGVVDNDAFCPCKRGEVRGCFAGPPGRRGVGACEDGLQVCAGEEFPSWGACRGSQPPHSEVCDGLDNDCNGCRDEIAGCVAKLSCPAPGDPRTPDAQPYTPYALNAKQFYSGSDATAYRWTVRGSPCDQLFASLDSSATAQSGKLSYALDNASASATNAHFSLSGRYEVGLTVTTPSGQLSCQWSVHVRSPGVRVELCWDKTGPSQVSQAVDLDLHLGKLGQTSWNTPSDCYWETCRGDMTPWSYGNTEPLSLCSGDTAQNYPAYSVLGFCPNPRLDADNRLDSRSRASYVTENINLDNPSDGDQFRVMVHYNTNVLADVQDADAGPLPSIDAHPIVNVYCGGALAGSFGGDPEHSGDSEELSLSHPGQMWRVADIKVAGDSCSINPLAKPGTSSEYYLTEFESTYGP